MTIDAEMRRKWFVLLVLAGIFALGSGSARAEDRVFALRCQSRLVSIGDRKVDVLAKCGQPLYQEVIGERKIKRGAGTERLILEEWVYNFGPTDFIHILRFQGGRLVEILRGERGYTIR